MATVLLHDTPDFGDLVEVLAGQMGIDPSLVEKDYWIMHALWGLQVGGFVFELKGGTSLSKGYQLIHRFSEDIDILIHPEGALPVGRNHTKAAHVTARRAFFDGLAQRIAIPGIQAVDRDDAFDDPTGQMRGAGIRLRYPELNPLPEGVKTGVLLEAGFDQVSPNRPVTISSWAYELRLDQKACDQFSLPFVRVRIPTQKIRTFQTVAPALTRSVQAQQQTAVVGVKHEKARGGFARSRVRGAREAAALMNAEPSSRTTVQEKAHQAASRSWKDRKTSRPGSTRTCPSVRETVR